MKVAIMQPYIFPYIGYFQLIHSVDKFVLYDDVNFIKKGWINRNNILINHQKNLFTIPLEKVSQNELIKNTNIHPHTYAKWSSKFLRSMQQSYAKAPHCEEVMALVKEVFESDSKTISELASLSIRRTLEYLEIDKDVMLSSKHFSDSKELDRAERLMSITKNLQSLNYVNAAAGKEIYNKDEFAENGIKLEFVKVQIDEYKQFGKEFVPGLSIIDVMMFNSKDDIKRMLNSYTLE